MSDSFNGQQDGGQTPQKTEKQKFKNAICYIPFVAIVLFFVEQDKTPELEKHIKYGIGLFIGYMIVSFISSNFLPFLHLGGIFALVYLVASAYLAYKAHLGEDIEIKTIDDIEKKIKENVNK